MEDVVTLAYSDNSDGDQHLITVASLPGESADYEMI